MNFIPVRINKWIARIAWIVFGLLMFTYLSVTILYYALIAEKNRIEVPAAKPSPGTKLDNYEGVWAESDEDCLLGASSRTRTLIDTTGRYDRFKDYKFQCDLANANTPEPGTWFELGCWKTTGKQRAKSISDFKITEAQKAMLDARMFVRCER